VSDTATIHGYSVVFDRGESGKWGAYVEDIPGACVAVADTREECERKIGEAIDAHLEALELHRRGEFLPVGVSQPHHTEFPGSRHRPRAV